jgi:putative transposase
MKRPRFAEEQIIAMLRGQEASGPAAELCHKHRVSSPTFDDWKAKLDLPLQQPAEIKEMS